MVFGSIIILYSYIGINETPPPSGNFMITQDGDYMITEDSNRMITE